MWNSYAKKLFKLLENIFHSLTVHRKQIFFSFFVFVPVLPLSDLDPSFYFFSVLIIFLLMYILILLVSNKQVSKHKFENRYFLNKKNFLKFSEKHFWDVFQVIWLLYRSINLVKSCLTKDSLLDISKLFKKRFF